MLRGCMTLFFLAMGGCGVLVFIGSRNPTAPAARKSEAIQSAAATPSPAVEPPKPGSQWTDLSSEDSMGRKRTIKAINSTNTLSFGFPYQGEQYAGLLLRKSQDGTDVIVQINKGQFLCSFNECAVNVRFDDGPVRRVSASGPTDNSTTVLFLSGASGLIQQMKKAKTTKIEATFYQEGSRVLEFNTEALTWP